MSLPGRLKLESWRALLRGTSMNSLQGRVLGVAAITIVLCWVISFAALTVYMPQIRASVWDTRLEAYGTNILSAIPNGKDFANTGKKSRIPLRDTETASNQHIGFQVWVDRQRAVARTPNAPDTPLDSEFGEGLSIREVAGRTWRVYSASDSSGHIHVQVGNLQSVVDAETREKTFIRLGIVTPLLAMLGGFMWYAVRRSLRPLVAVQNGVRQRQKFDLTPLPIKLLPTEIRPLVESFNHLLDQLNEAIQSERRFIGDAAHELRTPLSALQAQAEVALRATTLADKDIALGKLLLVARRSMRLSEQLLDLARLDAGKHAPHEALADLSELIVYVASEFDIYAELQNRVLVLETESCLIRCDVDEIGVLLRNLIDNALRYTTEGGRVKVCCRHCDVEGSAHVCLEVADDGPGVPHSEHAAIFERFHRVASTGARGSGIGLSLVAGIARLHGAIIETGAGLDDRGLSVRVLFPLPAEPDIAGRATSGEASSAPVDRAVRRVDQNRNR